MVFSVKKFFDAIKKLCHEENISEKKMHDITMDSLQQAYIQAILKDTSSMEKPNIKISFDKRQTEINFYLVKKIVEHVKDDMLEIELKNAQDITGNKKLKYGNSVEILDSNFKNKNDLEIFINYFKKIFQRKLDEEKREALYYNFKDKIGHNVIGTVEKIDNRGVTVKIGDVDALLLRKDMIGEEFFSIGQQIKVFLNDTSTDEHKSISITRANEGFLRNILEEEIYEIYDGTVVIEKIVRIAGKRSKVSAYSTINEVNVAGSCIGKNGIRLAKVIEQLNGNGYDKERIDIIPYSKNILIYIINAIRPAEAIGVLITDEKNKKAICVVKNGQFLKAVGLKGVNVRLASELTGYELTILEEEEANNKNIEYTTKEELDLEEQRKKEEKKKKDFLEQAVAYKALYDENKDDKNKKHVVDNIENVEENKNINNENKYSKKQKQQDNEEIAIDMEKFANIQTSTSLSDLEKQIDISLEKEKTKEEKNIKNSYKKTKSNKKEKENEDQILQTKKVEVYTKEELEQLDKEAEKEEIGDNDDYSDDEYEDYYGDEE